VRSLTPIQELALTCLSTRTRVALGPSCDFERVYPHIVDLTQRGLIHLDRAPGEITPLGRKVLELHRAAKLDV
jgi:hypothetical protein